MERRNLIIYVIILMRLLRRMLRILINEITTSNASHSPRNDIENSCKPQGWSGTLPRLISLKNMLNNDLFQHYQALVLFVCRYQYILNIADENGILLYPA